MSTAYHPRDPVPTFGVHHQGDSGGPLQCRAGGRWELRGLTSFGSGCARAGVPDVYTNVRHYVAWIHHHMYEDID
ncbi:unnamed protein product [Plutella xylostella]|uniref:(diamondback moth) hypothetical protein n=1 Tax=Plutella xylostella TaxID=51655 RepID=A0A8S4EYV7_PLUXY|nr:unnamed protein product [Plutella xylostella]